MSSRRLRTRSAPPRATAAPRPQAGPARPRTSQEPRSLRQALVHRRSLRELTSGLAHDLNNTLHAMRLRLELLRRDTEFAARSAIHLDALLRIIHDADTRVRRLQELSQQRRAPPRERVQLADIIREAVEIARGDIEHRAAAEGLTLRIETQVPRLPEVSGDAADLRFVFINLLLNARDAMPHGGTIRVRGARVDGQVRVAVEDEGTGIPVPHLRDIFQPFFTTKGLKGTGLGLSMAFDVVSSAGGTLHAANRPNGGAVFTLTFPPCPPPKKKRGRGQEGHPAGG